MTNSTTWMEVERRLLLHTLTTQHNPQNHTTHTTELLPVDVSRTKMREEVRGCAASLRAAPKRVARCWGAACYWGGCKSGCMLLNIRSSRETRDCSALPLFCAPTAVDAPPRPPPRTWPPTPPHSCPGCFGQRLCPWHRRRWCRCRCCRRWPCCVVVRIGYGKISAGRVVRISIHSSIHSSIHPLIPPSICPIIFTHVRVGAERRSSGPGEAEVATRYLFDWFVCVMCGEDGLRTQPPLVGKRRQKEDAFPYTRTHKHAYACLLTAAGQWHGPSCWCCRCRLARCRGWGRRRKAPPPWPALCPCPATHPHSPLYVCNMLGMWCVGRGVRREEGGRRIVCVCGVHALGARGVRYEKGVPTLALSLPFSQPPRDVTRA